MGTKCIFGLSEIYPMLAMDPNWALGPSGLVSVESERAKFRVGHLVVWGGGVQHGGEHQELLLPQPHATTAALASAVVAEAIGVIATCGPSPIPSPIPRPSPSLSCNSQLEDKYKVESWMGSEGGNQREKGQSKKATPTAR